MKTNLLKYILSILIPVVAVSGIVYAGSLTPPGSVLNTMYTLEDIYNRASGTTATEGSGAIPATPGSASATFHTLTEIYEAIDNMRVTKLLKTGQTTCYSGNTATLVACDSTVSLEDGFAQRGESRSYTDNGDGTITDNATGLMWQKCLSGRTGLDCSGGWFTPMTFSAATSTCANASTGGYSDWKLPNIIELRSLTDFSSTNYALPPALYFPNTATTSGNANTWSSTSYASTTNGGQINAWTLDATVGYSWINPKNTANSVVRCVRAL